MRHLAHWNVRNRFVVAFIVVAVVPLVVFGTLVYSRTANALREVERRQIEAQATGAREVLRQRMTEERVHIHDYAVWDEFHAALREGRTRWVDDNVADWVPTNSDTNVVVVYDPSGEQVAHGGDGFSGSLWANELVQAARRGETGVDLTSLGGRLYVIAAAPIVAQTYPSRPAGVLVFAQAVTDAVLESVNRFTGGQGRLSVYTAGELSAATGPAEASEALRHLGEEYAARDAGVELREIAGGWMLVTTAAQAEWVGRMLRGKRKMRLSRAALESMAIIAYKQPVTKSEVEAIRGVDSSAVLSTLLERNLVTIRGRSKVVGRPLLYGTTQEFLEYFGLKDLSELPRPEELRALVAAREPEQLDMMELEVVSQVASDLAASEAAHPDLITRHEIVPVGAADVVQSATQVATDFAAAVEFLGLPIMVKPVREGSSIGMSKVTRAEDLSGAYEHAAQFDEVIIGEQFIEGTELTAGVLGTTPLPLIRLETPRTFYDYEAKYLVDSTRYILPSGLPEDKESDLKQLALKAFSVPGCRGCGRVDLMLDRAGDPYFLEVNTIPGMTDHSLVPMAARAAGYSFEDLVLAILEQAR